MRVSKLSFLLHPYPEEQRTNNRSEEGEVDAYAAQAEESTAPVGQISYVFSRSPRSSSVVLRMVNAKAPTTRMLSSLEGAFASSQV